MPDDQPRAKGTTPRRQPLTHFLCLPLVSAASKPALESNSEIFRRDVCYEHDGEPSSIHPKAIRPVGTLHLTLGVMSLRRDSLERAIALLQSLDLDNSLQEPLHPSQLPTRSGNVQSTPSAERTGPPPLNVTLRGLESMHDPKNTSILYVAPEDSSGRLLDFCLAIQKTFREAGFLIPDNRPLKLHATIVNTIYAKRSATQDKASSRPKTRVDENGIVRPVRTEAGPNESSGHGPSANAPMKINAVEILDRYKHFVWASDVVLEEIAICEMGAKPVRDDGGQVADEQYTVVASAPLPTP